MKWEDTQEKDVPVSEGLELRKRTRSTVWSTAEKTSPENWPLGPGGRHCPESPLTESGGFPWRRGGMGSPTASQEIRRKSGDETRGQEIVL